MRIAPLGLLLLLTAFAGVSQARMVHRSIEWNQDGTRFHSVLIYDDATRTRRPGLVMVPNSTVL